MKRKNSSTLSSSQDMGGWTYTKAIQIRSDLTHLTEKVPQWEQMISKFLTASIYHREWFWGREREGEYHCQEKKWG